MATIPQAMAIALRQHRAGRLQDAEQIYRQVLQAYPNHAAATHFLGVIAHQTGRHELAIELIQRAIGLKGDAADFHYNLANVFDALHRSPEAAVSYRRAIELKPAFAQAHDNLGLALNAQGKREEAIGCFVRALEINPDLAGAHNNLGLALKEQGKLDEAVASFGRALQLKPALAEAHSNLGNAYKAQGKLDEAIASYRQALAANPRLAEGHRNLGVALSDQRKLEEAVACFHRAVALKPDFGKAYNDLGVTLKQMGRGEEAVACFQRAVELEPGLTESLNNLGLAFKNCGQLEEAVACFRRALAQQPDLIEAQNNLGNALREQGQLEEAIACYRRALELRPDYADAHNNLGLAFREQGRAEEALACFHRALELKPDFAEAHNNVGEDFRDRGMFDEALACYRRALALRPDLPELHKNLGIHLLLLGRYEEGWAEYEHRLSCPPLVRMCSKPRWKGAPAEGETILIHSEQGFGDTLQLFRYAPLVRARAAAGRVILQCPPKLARLLSRNAGDQLEIAAALGSDKTRLPSFDWHVPLLSLPLTLGMSEPLAISRPYLTADPALRAVWRERLDRRPRFRVGVIWLGNPEHKGDRSRSLPLSELFPIFRLPDIRFYSLQIARDARRSPPILESGLTDLTAGIDDFEDTAAFMAELDLVISVDTAAAHLAGSLGLPVWVLLPFSPDWRWKTEGESTPWYPTMRLFRQRAAGDWGAVVERLALELSRQRDSTSTVAGVSSRA